MNEIEDHRSEDVAAGDGAEPQQHLAEPLMENRKRDDAECEKPNHAGIFAYQGPVRATGCWQERDT